MRIPRVVKLLRIKHRLFFIENVNIKATEMSQPERK